MLSPAPSWEKWPLSMVSSWPNTGFPGGSAAKIPPDKAGDTGEEGWIPGSGKSPGGGKGNPLQYSCAWGIPWTEEPGGLQSTGLQKSTRLSTVYSWHVGLKAGPPGRSFQV